MPLSYKVYNFVKLDYLISLLIIYGVVLNDENRNIFNSEVSIPGTDANAS